MILLTEETLESFGIEYLELKICSQSFEQFVDSKIREFKRSLACEKRIVKRRRLFGNGGRV